MSIGILITITSRLLLRIISESRQAASQEELHRNTTEEVVRIQDVLSLCLQRHN